MTLIISKADFTPANLVKFSQNIKDDQIEPYIYAAQDYDLRPRLGEELYNDILKLCSFDTNEERPELMLFVNEHVKRFLVLSSYYRFIATHGINVTQFGLSSTRDPQGTFDQVEASQRAVVLRQVASDINVSLIRMTKNPYNFDSKLYDQNDRSSSQNQMIRAPKKNKTKTHRYSWKDVIM